MDVFVYILEINSWAIANLNHWLKFLYHLSPLSKANFNSSTEQNTRTLLKQKGPQISLKRPYVMGNTFTKLLYPTLPVPENTGFP